ncbi:hypothetical protein Nmel_016701 [Mimus melanotis]
MKDLNNPESLSHLSAFLAVFPVVYSLPRKLRTPVCSLPLPLEDQTVADIIYIGQFRLSLQIIFTLLNDENPSSYNFKKYSTLF